MNFPKAQILFACAAVLLSQNCLADNAEIEREQLRLILVQLNNVQALADRSKTSRENTSARYRFDYPLLAQDIEAVRSGIEHYLTPARAQPRDVQDVAPLNAGYRKDRLERTDKRLPSAFQTYPDDVAGFHLRGAAARHQQRAGAGSQNAIGNGVLFGMMTATVLGLFYTPLFFVVVSRVFQRSKKLDFLRTDRPDH